MDNNFDIFEMMKQAVDLQFDKIMKLLGEYGIHGLRAHEFIMKFGALGNMMQGGEKE